MDRSELLGALKSISVPDKDVLSEDIPEDPGFWWRLVHLNPVLYRGLVMGFVSFLGAFGLAFSNEKGEAIVGFITVLLLFIQAAWTRGSVVASKKVVVYKPNPVDEPHVLAPGEAVSTNFPAVMNAAADNGSKSIAELPFPEKAS